VTANANPVILDSKGEAGIWTSGRFKVNITDANDVQITGYPVDNLGASQSSYDIASFSPLVNQPDATILNMKMIRGVNFDINMAGSSAISASTTSDQISLSIQKNGIQFGTIDFDVNTLIGAFNAPIPPIFNAGDILSIVVISYDTSSTMTAIGIILAGQIAP
jgi:hypothetical protein